MTTTPTRIPRWGRALVCVAGGVIGAGCAPASEVASLQLAVDEAGTFVGVYADSSAARLELSLDWSLVVDNRGAQPCPVAVYRWTDALPDPAILPSSSAGPWPDRWNDGELVATAVVDADTPAVFEASEPDAEAVAVLLGLAVCPDARLVLDVRAEASADLGIRSITEALTVELWQIEPAPSP
jgi:hypothetical protein